jgi:ribulose-phosphate 3-epimerase
MIISLSILNIESNERKSKIKDFMNVNNNWIHFDVMDGEFVPNKTFAYEVVEEVNSYCDFFKDVHLMTYFPDKCLREYKEAGADQITIHYESMKEEDILPVIEKIKLLNMKTGLSIKPSTNIINIEKFLPYLDLVLVMSVEPGKGGQKFMMNAVEKIKYLKEQKDKFNYKYLIEVDGGINDETKNLVKGVGCEVVVAGSFVFKSDDYQNAISRVR